VKNAVRLGRGQNSYKTLPWISLSEDLRVYGRMILKCISTKKTRSGVKHGMDPSGSG
jgi:hypothetical protein